jgi:hypothetical protein
MRKKTEGRKSRDTVPFIAVLPVSVQCNPQQWARAMSDTYLGTMQRCQHSVLHPKEIILLKHTNIKMHA